MGNGIRQVCSGIWRSYQKRMESSRFWVSVVMLVVLDFCMVTGMDTLMQKIGYKITPFMAPHFFATIIYVTYFAFIICYMYSDVPFMSRSELYWVLREGRLCWCAGKAGAIILQGITMTVIAMLLTVVVYLPNVTYENDWGKSTDTLSYSTDTAIKYNIFNGATPWIVEKYTPWQAVGLCFLLVSLVVCLVGLLMFAISLYAGRTPAVITGLLLANLQLAVEYFPEAMGLYYASPWSWIMLGTHGEISELTYRYPSLEYCLSASVMLLTVTVILIGVRVRRLEFNWYKEE